MSKTKSNAMIRLECIKAAVHTVPEDAPYPLGILISNAMNIYNYIKLNKNVETVAFTQEEAEQFGEK